MRSGPIDYDALELLLHQERMKAARLHAQEQQKMEAEWKTVVGLLLVRRVHDGEHRFVGAARGGGCGLAC